MVHPYATDGTTKQDLSTTLILKSSSFAATGFILAITHDFGDQSCALIYNWTTTMKIKKKI
jgi:hypothetical protein